MSETILDKIVKRRLADLEKTKTRISEEQIRSMSKEAGPAPFDFQKMLLSPASGSIHLIAEVKKASPSKGVLREDFNPLEIARAYARGGASALSVLTEVPHFQGNDEYLREISHEVPLPTLRKDFILDIYQIHEARVLGASAFLLICDCLDPKKLAELIQEGKSLGMHALVEVHREDEIKMAMDCGAGIIGINNRNLRTFETSLDTTLRLRHLVPENISLVSESGISTHQHVQRLKEAGVHAALVGEGIVKHDNWENRVRELISG